MDKTSDIVPVCGKASDKPPSSRRSARSHVTKWMALSAFASIFGGTFLYGFHLAVWNNPEKDLQQRLGISNDTTGSVLFGAISGLFPVGGLVGALLGPLLAEKIGRKYTLLLNNVPNVLGVLLMAISMPCMKVALMVLGRFFVGISAGISTIVSPLYLSELSPVSIRGVFGVLNQFGINLGILCAIIISLPQILGAMQDLSYLISVGVVPCAVQLLILPFCPSSPKYLFITKNNPEEARKALSKLRGVEELGAEMEAVQKEEEEAARYSRAVSIAQLLTNRTLRQALIISVVMQVANQLTGINAVVSFSNGIFSSAGISNSVAATCGMGAVAVMLSLLTVPLIETLGRRTLMFSGLLGMMCIYILIIISMSLQTKYPNLSYISMACVLLLMAVFQVGPGPIPWFLVSELFDQGPRAAATSLAGLVNWTGAFIILFGYPPMSKLMFHFVFIIFAALSGGLALYTFMFVPETKGKSTAEISEVLRSRNRRVLNERS